MTSFLYMLLRDHLPAGEVEAIMVEVRKAAGKQVTFSNVGLAQYAAELSAELRTIDDPTMWRKEQS